MLIKKLLKVLDNPHRAEDMTISKILQTIISGRRNRGIQFQATKIFRRILKTSYFAHMRKV